MLKSVYFSVLLLIMSIASMNFVHMHHKAHLKFYIEQFPPTSTCIKHQILRAYSQWSMWHNSPFIENIKMNPVKYRHKFDEGENLVPEIITEPPIPVNFSIPCNYSKCLQPAICLCKQRQIVCYRYRKC